MYEGGVVFMETLEQLAPHFDPIMLCTNFIIL